MTDNAFAAILAVASFPIGMAGGMLGVWIARWTIAALVMP